MLQTIRHRLIRKRERGQSIIVLAFGFVALLMFVGIVTDISLMFVRYSTLRRAVDSAAIAAAGQMRQDRNFANVQLAARQFVEFHGLDPELVLVETCQTEAGLAEATGRAPDDELCTDEQRKLVRVTAQISSPTIFLRLMGWNDILLEASAISETAVLDVVIVMDVSESMVEDTTYDQWDAIGMGYVYAPPTVWDLVEQQNGGAATSTQWATKWEQLVVDVQASGDPMDYDYTGGMRTTAPNSRYTLPDGRELPDLMVRGEWPGGTTATLEPRRECQVRFWSNSAAGAAVPRELPTDPTPTNLLNFFRDMPGTNGTDWRDRQRPNASFYDGWVPVYDFYGCCNDPGTASAYDPFTGTITMGSNVRDWNFNDLICEPFKSARDATFQFLQTIDFVRGDRVAFVTFDQQAYLIDPDGADGVVIGTETTAFSHMIDERTVAERTLTEAIGVRTEPAFYVWNEDGGILNGGGWAGFAGQRPDGTTGIVRGSYLGQTVAVGQNDFAPNNNPVQGDCVFYNAALAWPYSPYTNRIVPGATEPIFYRAVAGSSPLRYVMTPGEPGYTNPLNGQRPRTIDQYTFRGACRGTNVGAALREANNALTDTTTIRETNTVWVIVFLGDGAAGASDPVLRNGAAPGNTGNPYANNGVNPIPTDYGVYGVCPYGTIAEPGELLENDGFPFCSDEDPTTRQSCVSSAPGNEFFPFTSIACPDDPTQACVTVDIAAPGCSPDYDVDDYARDWADFVGLQDNSEGGALLPTIFTIGFGLEFRSGTGSCADNIPDCLGEELLRYIADVGDNYNLDIDYQQAFINIRDGRAADFELGPAGVCERAQSEVANPLNPDLDELLAPRQQCGNYFNAPDAAELQLVFDEIASRMFTRIAR